MKNDKKWLKDSINELKTIFNGRKMSEYETGMLDGYTHVSMLIDYLDEPEKPAIPKFVADYIEKWKHEGLTIYEWFSFGNNDVDEDIEKWLYDNTIVENTRREYLLFDALRYGYEVEKDPKYYVLDKEGATLLKKSSVSEGVAKSVGTTISSAKSWKDEKKYQLTEQEIKDYDERFWPFAVKVEEMEE